MSFSFQVKAKKTPFQRQKELEEERKKRDDAEAAKVYEEFVKEFAVDNESDRPPRGHPGGRGGRGAGPRPPAAFVRGGTMRPGQPPAAFDEAGGSAGGSGGGSGGPAAAPAKKTGGRYVPSFMPPGMAAAMEKAGEPGGKGGDEAAAAGKKDESVFQLPGSSSKAGGKPRAIDALLANLKREQEEREARKEQGLPLREELGPGGGGSGPGGPGGPGGSFDSGDPFTTNLFIGNLAPDVDEQVLMREFGRFGPLGSVKVMWPRDDEQRRRGRNNGFVSFMKREDAACAMEALDGVVLHDMALTIGWGKAVPLPAVPCWPPPGGLAAPREGGAAVPPPVGGEDSFHQGPPGTMRDRQQPFRPGRGPKFGGGLGGVRKPEVRGVGPDIEVQIPDDGRQRFIIDAVAFYVMRDGCEFEQVIMEREQSNPEFNFLFDIRCPEHAYYRWRLFSLASGDTLRSWRVDKFQMVENSNCWLPPPMTVGVMGRNKTAAQRGEARRGGEDLPLSDLQRDKFEHMLRQLTVERADICGAMAWALDNAESATEVAEILGDSLTLSETPIPLKIARLFLLSDILHNTSSGVRNASRYRSRLEEVLPDVFESLQEAYRCAEGRMAQELLRRYVLKVLRVWRGWFVFSDDFINGLQATFLRSGGSDAGAAAHNSALEAELEALGDEELETRCRRSGVSRKGGRSAQISRLLALDAYLNGDSIAAAKAKEEATPRAAANPVSSWAEVGPEPAAGAAAPPAGGGGGGGGGPKSKWEQQDDADQQQQRQAGVAASAPRSKWDAQEEEEERGGRQQQQQPPLPGAHAAQVASGDRQPSSRWLDAGAGAGAAESDSDDDLAATVAAAKRQAAAAAAAAPAAAVLQRGGSAGGGSSASGSMSAAAAAATAAVAAAEAPSSGDPALDEERRQRLRQVEVVLVQFRERLEDKGLSRQTVEAKVAEQRAKLVADAEAALAAKAAAAGGAGGGSSSRERGREAAAPPSSSHKDRRRSRSRSRDRDRERSDRDRDRERERSSRDRKRSRSRSRSRSKERGSRRRSSRSRSPRRSRRSSRSRSRERRR